MQPVINYWAVLVAALSAIVLGFVWYGPLFGKLWMKLIGATQESMEAAKKKGMNKEYALMAVGSLLMAFVLAHTTVFAMEYTKTFGVVGGLMSGFWTWLGFFAPLQLDEVLWSGKPWKLFFLNTGFRFVSLLIMGVILATWR